MNKPEPTREPAPALKPFGNHCGGCSTSIAPGLKFCTECAKKDFNKAPQASMELAKQPTPAYDREPVQTSNRDDE